MSSVATIASVRLFAAAAIATALGFQAWADLTLGTFTWAQLPGYFTPLAAIAGIVALVASSVRVTGEPLWISLLRVNAATYLVIAGAVYWWLLAEFANPIFPWANAMLHGGAGFILTVDWLLVGPRRRLPWWSVFTVFTMPAGWLAYLVVRATVDGWVPYPFLDPARGSDGLVAVTIIVAVGLAIAALLHLCAGLYRRVTVVAPHHRRENARPAGPRFPR